MSETAASTPPDQEIATARSDPWRWYYGDRIGPEDQVLASRGGARGLAIYDDLERDAQVATCMQQRRDALAGREWQVEPGDESRRAKQAAELVTAALDGIRFNQAVRKLQQAVLRGIAVTEVLWQPGDATLLPAKLLDRDPRRFVFKQVADQPMELRLRTRGSGLDGIALPPRRMIVHSHGGLYENPWGLGVGHRVWWSVYFKRQGIGFWMSGLEKFGQPTVLGKYPPGTAEDDQKTLLAACVAIASENAAVIPDGMVVELVEAKRAGTFDTYKTLCDYMDAEIAKAILGQTLTTSQGDRGSQSLGNVHNEVRLELVKADADALSDTLNHTLVRWIVELNLPGYAGPMPRLWWDVSVPEDLAARAKRDVDIASLGFRPTLEYITEAYGEGWEEKAPPPMPPPPPIPPPAPGAAPPDPAAGDALATMFADAIARRRQPGSMPPATDPRDAADHLAEQLDDIAGAAQDAMIGAVKGVLDRSGSLAEFRDGLVKLMPILPTEAYAELLGQAMSVAALQGRTDIADGP